MNVLRGINYLLGAAENVKVLEVAENKCVQQLFLNDIKIKCKENKALHKYLALQKPYYLINSWNVILSTLLTYYYAVIIGATSIFFANQ